MYVFVWFVFFNQKKRIEADRKIIDLTFQLLLQRTKYKFWRMSTYYITCINLQTQAYMQTNWIKLSKVMINGQALWLKLVQLLANIPFNNHYIYTTFRQRAYSLPLILNSLFIMFLSSCQFECYNISAIRCNITK